MTSGEGEQVHKGRVGVWRDRAKTWVEAKPRLARFVAAVGFILLAFLGEFILAVSTSLEWNASEWDELLNEWFNSPAASIFALALLTAAFVDSLFGRGFDSTHRLLPWLQFAVLVVVPFTYRPVLDGTADPYLQQSMTVVGLALVIASLTPYNQWSRHENSD